MQQRQQQTMGLRDKHRPAQPVSPIHAEIKRLERITVCTRPFRAAGPRIEAERFGDKLLIHNYGHGGSGWSLSWGSAERVVALAAGSQTVEAAVIGCGALGLTAAIALQRAGRRVRIYARELPPEVRSSRATGSWTPDARVALASSVDGSFATAWERMARSSHKEFCSLLHLPGEPVKVQPRFLLSAAEPAQALREREAKDPIGFLHLEDRLHDLWPAARDFAPGEHAFAGLYCRQLEIFRFDITAYSEHLLHEFRERGGVLQRASFAASAELQHLPEKLVVNCTGYGARALFQDESLTPIRGQINWLPAQPEVQYSLQWEGLNVVSRPDGMVVQLGAGGDPMGWQDASEEPDVEEAAKAIRLLAELQTRMQPPQTGCAF